MSSQTLKSKLIYRRYRQPQQAFAGAAADAFGVQHGAALSSGSGIGAENVGAVPSVWKVSQATPCGSVTQYLSYFA